MNVWEVEEKNIIVYAYCEVLAEEEVLEESAAEKQKTSSLCTRMLVEMTQGQKNLKASIIV